MLTRAGSVVYATHCNPVQVVPRSLAPGNCSHEVPASYNGTDVFVDPINWVIRPLETTVHCSDVAPPLSLGDRAKDMMLDHVGWSFIPLY